MSTNKQETEKLWNFIVSLMHKSIIIRLGPEVPGSHQFDVCELLGEDEGVVAHAHHVALLTRSLFALQGGGAFQGHGVERGHGLLVLAERWQAFDQPLGHLLHRSPGVLEAQHNTEHKETEHLHLETQISVIQISWFQDLDTRQP